MKGRDLFEAAYGSRFPLFGSIPTNCVISLMALLPEHARVCDIGSGDGRDSLYLLRQGFTVLALDWSAKAIENLRSEGDKLGLGEKLTTTVADVTEFDLGKECFDAVVGITILDHLSVEARDDLLQRALDAVAPGGYAVFESYSDRDPLFVEEEESGSEFADAIQSRYGANEMLIPLLRQNWRVIHYSDRREHDEDHGLPHDHGFITVIARKPEGSEDMKNGGLVLELAVEDVPRSIGFYRDVLGMALIETVPESESDAVWAELDHDGSRLMLQERTELAKEIPASAGRGPGAALLVVRLVGKATGDALWERLNAARIEPVSPPSDTDYGTREFGIQDPDGYIVLIAIRNQEN